MKKPSRPTFRAHRSALLDALRRAGWAIDALRKVPIATHPEGTPRLYFKTQSVYVSTASGGTHTLARATSLWSDIRDLSADELVRRACPLPARRATCDACGRFELMPDGDILCSVCRAINVVVRLGHTALRQGAEGGGALFECPRCSMCGAANETTRTGLIFTQRCGACYACDDDATGTRDLIHENRGIVRACERHRDRPAPEPRNVRWYEARQERAIDAAERRGRLARRIAEAERVGIERVIPLCDEAERLRASSRRYGRAKARIGEWTSFGWRDAPRAIGVAS